MMQYRYRPQGVCSQEMLISVEDGVIRDLKVIGGCSGNLQGIARLVTGMTMEEAAERLNGIRCGYKSTSCPDQLAKALQQIIEQEKSDRQ